VSTARKTSAREEFTGPAHLAAMLMLSGYALRTWRARYGSTLAEMAARLGCTDGHLSRVERGTRLGPTPEHAARALGMTVAEFLEPCRRCEWTPYDGTCPECGTSQSAGQVAAEIVSWLVRGGS
jgi:transcriptional regulator with XRE-family HTH domain